MILRLLSRHHALSTAGRFRLPPRTIEGAISFAELLALLGCGIAAAGCVLLADFKLKLPGHAILRAVFPMALGFSLVPRRGAGTVMGVGAVATAALLISGGWVDKGLGSLTSLMLVGPVLDLAMRRSAPGRSIYLSFMAAGVATNFAAMTVQAAAKYFGWDSLGGGKNLAAWFVPAFVSYPLCGALAGLISATTWFRLSDESRSDANEDRA